MCDQDRPEALTKRHGCVCVWLSEITGPVIYVDIEPAVLIQTLTAEVGVRDRMKRGGG